MTIAGGRLEHSDRVHLLESHLLAVQAFAVGLDGERIVSGAGDRRLMLWERESGRKLSQWSSGVGGINACGFTPEGIRLIVATGKQLALWDPEAHRVHATFEPPGISIPERKGKKA